MENVERIIFRLSTGLVIFLVVGSFVLTYKPLWEMAYTYGHSYWTAWLWPLLLDAVLIIFLAALVRGYLFNESVWWSWVWVVVFAAGIIVFSWSQVGDNWNAIDLGFVSIEFRYLVSAVPMVAMLLGFEILMSQRTDSHSQAESLTDMENQPVIIIGDTDPKTMKPVERQRYIAQMMAQGVAEDKILELFGISGKTLSRDIKVLSKII